VPLTTASYSQLLVDLDTHNNHNSVTLTADLAYYSSSVSSYRNNLTNVKSWTIIDAGQI